MHISLGGSKMLAVDVYPTPSIKRRENWKKSLSKFSLWQVSVCTVCYSGRKASSQGFEAVLFFFVVSRWYGGLAKSACGFTNKMANTILSRDIE